MLLTSVIFSLALLLPHVDGQTTFCNGNLLPCVENAECDATSDTCQCSATFRGNGRVACRDASTRCVCTALADPRFGLFDPPTTGSSPSQISVKANLPCSVLLVENYFITASNCLIRNIIAHPETRGTGAGANLRVFVKELEVDLGQPEAQFTVDASGTTLTGTGDSLIAQGSNADNFNTATVATCSDLEIGFNGTYGGAYIDTVFGSTGSPRLCGNCDGDNNENAGTTNTTNLGYLLGNLAATADQQGPYATQCGTLEALIEANCDAAELALVGDVCGRYLSDFGVCLVSTGAVADFATLLSSNFQTCLLSICTTGTTDAQCTELTTVETAACQVGDLPASCPAP